MPPGFHVELGPFTVDVQLDDSGVRMQRGPRSFTIPWNKITAATLVRPQPSDNLPDDREQTIAQFAGPQALQKLRELQSTVGEISIAYRNERNSLQRTEVPAPLADPAFLNEFQTRLANRWLGETRDRNQVGKRLHTDPGFFKTVFILIVLIGIVAGVAVIFLFGLLGPVLNLLSIQRMLLDLQDGNFTGFAQRLGAYIALFVLGLLLHRVIRAKLDARKRALPSRSFFSPH